MAEPPAQEASPLKDGRALPDWLTPHVAALLLWAPFLLAWIWSARYNPLNHIPAYGDVLEVVWGANWYAEHLRQFANPLYFNQIFFPVGWPTALLAHTPIFLAVMGFFRLFLAEAPTFNLFLFLSFVAAYAGMIRAARLYTKRPWIVALVALLYTFWGMRWVRLGGHLNILWLSALLPWLFWSLQLSNARRRVISAALVWALCIIASLYGIWLGALVVGVYLLNKPSWDRLCESAFIAALTLLFSLPTLILFWRARQMVAAPFYSFEHIAGWGASLNSLPIPAVFHPWLGALARMIYRGPVDESAVANLGLVAAALFIVFLLRSRMRDEQERFVLLLCVVGLIIALGPLLRWDGRVVEAPTFAPLNGALWELGSLVKPDIFAGDIPPQLADGVPLPAWPFYATIPFLEGNRVVARFALVGGLGLVLSLAVLLDRLKTRWVWVVLAFFLLFERVPWPVLQGVPLPAAAHPAFVLVAQQAGAVIDLVPAGDQLILATTGETLYATSLHKQSTASGVSSMWPESAWFLFNWLQSHPRPLENEDFPVILQGYGIDRVLMHMETAASGPHIEGELASGLGAPICLEAPAQPSPWPYSICILQVAEPDEMFSAGVQEGWSAPELWGRWAVSTEALARWAVPVPQDYALQLDIFPNWIAGRVQEVTIMVNGQPIGRVTFERDVPVSKGFVVPASLLDVGWNELAFRSTYAVSPAEITGGANPDPRPLAFGVNRLAIHPVLVD
jgi:hypothetical protein